MIVSILLASLTLVGFSFGDDPTTSASNDVTTTAEPTYTLFYPADAPFFGFNETVGFTWEAIGYNTAFYVCHTAISMGDEALTRYWIASSSHELSSSKGKIYSNIKPPERSVHANDNDF